MRKTGLLLGYGRPVVPRGKCQRFVYSMPLIGRRVEQAIWPPESIATDHLSSPHIFVTAGSGMGKTRGLVVPFCLEALQQGSLVYFNGGGPGFRYFVRECVAHQVSPDKVCLVDPTYKHRELGCPRFDLLRPLPGLTEEETAEALVADMMTMSQRLSQPGPRQNDIGYKIFRLLQLEAGGLPLSEMDTFFYNVPIRQAWISRCPDQNLRAYWEYFEEHINPNQKAIILGPVANKWSPLLRSVFCGPMFSATESTVHLETIINTKGMALAVELSSARLGKDVAETLAQIFFSRLKMSIRQRESIPPAQLVPLTVVIDEYSFIRSPVVMEELYRLSRNLSVTMIVLTQDLTVFEESELRAITGSSGCILVMGCGQKEGERLVLELYRPTGTKRKSWKEERYYSPHEELYIMQDHLSGDKQKPQQGVVLLKPKGLYFLRTKTRDVAPEHPAEEDRFRCAVAAHWYRLPSRP